MGKNPAFQFYPADWERDLDGVPLEVEGFWIRLICKLWWADPKGTLTRSLPDFARTLAEDPRKVRRMFLELKNRCLADINNDGELWTISCRRMIRDEKIRGIRKQAGSLGGNPSLINKSILDNQKVNQTVNQNPTPSSSSSSSINLNKEKEKQGKEKEDRPFLKPETQEALNALLIKFPRFPVAKIFTWILREKKHPDAVLYAIKETTSKCSGIAPETYFTTILNRTSGNYYESDHTQQSQKYKSDPQSISTILQNISKKGAL